MFFLTYIGIDRGLKQYPFSEILFRGRVLQKNVVMMKFVGTIKFA